MSLFLAILCSEFGQTTRFKLRSQIMYLTGQLITTDGIAARKYGIDHMIC